jgi:2-polyprenyl-6-methoxyphenol hydroxylase-like FAD-dependent oxidoreductase
VTSPRDFARCSVLVVGAGPTGLLLAEQLGRRGVDVALVDKAGERVQESRALAVGARTLEILDDVGTVEEALSRGRLLRHIEAHEGRRTLASVELAETGSPFPFNLSLPQPDLMDLLASAGRAQGVPVRYTTEFVGCRQDPQGVTATLRAADGAEHTLRAQWLVGCDGAHSTVRAAVGIGGHHHDLHRSFLLADVSADWELRHDRLHPWLSKQGILVVLPLPRPGCWRVIANVPGTEGPHRPDRALLSRLLAERTPLAPDGITVDWLTTFGVREFLAAGYREGRVLLAGDAAHTHSPVGGQGMNLGLQDAYNLAWKLALVTRGQAGEHLLDSYEQERRPVADQVLRATTRATRVVTVHTPVARSLRRGALAVLSRLTPVRRKLALGATQLFVGYRHSPAVEDTRGGAASGGLQPGELAPDAFVHTGDAFATLRHCLRDREHVLLVFLHYEDHPRRISEVLAEAHAALGGWGTVLGVSRAMGAGDPARGLLGDRHGNCHLAFRSTEPGLCLVRPDRYVAYSSTGWEFGELRRYLDSLRPRADAGVSTR